MLERVLAFASIVVLATACASPRKSEVTAAFARLEPTTIWVDVGVDNGISQDAAKSVHQLIDKELTARGYTIGRLSDATMYVAVQRWGRDIEPQRGQALTDVSISAALRDDATTTLLWQGYGSGGEEDEQDEDDEKGDLLGAVLDYSLDKALASVTGDMQDAARDAVRDLLATLPAHKPPAH